MTTTDNLDSDTPALPAAKPVKARRSRKPTPLPVQTPSEEAIAADASKPVSKIATVVALLCRDGGATLAELVAATGWLPHTTRAALTGLRKKGHAIERGTRDGVTAYTVRVSG